MIEIETLTIRSEQEAWTVLQQALSNRIEETTQIVFEGWPVFKLTIEGRDFKGSIPTRIMPPILELQKEIYRLYCQARYNTEDTRKLSMAEREFLELIVFIKPGSTRFITELFKTLNEIIKNANMNGKEAVVLLVGVSTLIASNIGWKDWLASKEREHGMDVSVRLSEEETKRMALLTEALSDKPELRKNQEFITAFQGDISRKLKPEDTLKINEEPIITGKKAAKIVPKPRQEAQEVRIDGEFYINEVKFPKSFGGKYRFSITRVADNLNILVDASPETLSDDQIRILKDGGFGLKKVLMQINAKEIHGRISSANLVSIQWPATDNEN